MSFQNFVHNLVLNGLEYFNKYYGVYRGLVLRVNDPEHRGRIMAYVPQVGHTDANYPEVWIDPCFPGAGNKRGEFWPPEVGDAVWVTFQQGDPSFPAQYHGGWFGTADLPAEFAYSSGDKPMRRGLMTRMGHMILLDDETPQIVIQWHKPSSTPATDTETPPRTGSLATLTFQADGSIRLEDSAHNFIQLKQDEGVTIQDKNGSTVTMNSTKVEVNAGSRPVSVISSGNCLIEGGTIDIGRGASEPVVLGQTFLGLFNAHTHGTVAGPSTPPSIPLTAATLSSTVKVKR